MLSPGCGESIDGVTRPAAWCGSHSNIANTIHFQTLETAEAKAFLRVRNKLGFDSKARPNRVQALRDSIVVADLKTGTSDTHSDFKATSGSTLVARRAGI